MLAACRHVLFLLAAMLFTGCSRDETAAAGAKAETITENDQSFKIVRVDLQHAKVELFWRKPDGERFGTFAAVRSRLESSGDRWALITNSGIFDPDHKPLGLHVEQARE